MKSYLIVIFASIALFASCAKESLNNNATPGNEGSVINESNVVKGWIRIKLNDDAQPLKVGMFTRGASASGDSDLDMLAAELGATEIRRVFTPNARFEKRHRKYGLHLWFDVKFEDEVPVSRAADKFGALPNIAHVEPIHKIESTDGLDYIMPAKDGYTVGAKAQSKSKAAADMPFNDLELDKQWHYNNDGSVYNSVAGADINLFKAWEMYGAGTPNVIVAVMDGAIQTDHPDLAANMWINKGEIPDNGIDDDDNGYVDDVYGWNFDYPSQGLVTSSHGTHVAGTIGAVNHNGIGVCGVAGGTGNGDGVRMMTLQIYDAEGDASGRVHPDSYVYAADNGAVISQNSWNIPSMAGRPDMPEALEVAFEYFNDNAGCDDDGNQLPDSPMKGGVIIFSAGNRALGDAEVPSDYPGVICVAAMLPNYKKASYSNSGPSVDILAPGGSGSTDYDFTEDGRVYSTEIDNSYSYKTGTSMACPHVSGVAALIASKFGGQGFTGVELKQRLLRATRDVGAYQINEVFANGIGAGLVDAALIDLKDDGIAPAKPSSVTFTAENEKKLKVNITVPADSRGNAVSGFNMSYVAESDKVDQSKWVKTTIKNGQPIDAVRTVDVSGLADATNYIFRVTAIDRFGNESEYTEAMGKTIAHINRPPTHKATISPINFPLKGDVDNAFELTLDLNDYFTDPDLPNDKLTYVAESKDTSIVTVSIVDEHMLVVKAEGNGNTFLSIVARDIVGAKLDKGVTVKVSDFVSGVISIKKEFEPLTLPVMRDDVKVFEVSYSLDDYFTSEGALDFRANTQNPNILKLSFIDGGKTLVVKALSKGAAEVEVTASQGVGQSGVSQMLKVNVSETPDGGKLSVYPNPVADFAKINVTGSGNADGQVRIYDSAARLVKRSEVNFAGDILLSYDMRDLAPGVYTMVVNVSGTDYKSSFVKK